MPLFFLVILPILEIYVFIQVGNTFGYMNALFALVVSMVVGVGIAKSQGKFMFRHLQASLAQRKAPEARVVHSLLIFIGGVLLVVPGFLTTLAGLIFILPGTRHLLSFWLKARLLAQIGLGKLGIFGVGSLGGFRFGGGEMGGLGGFSARFGGSRATTAEDVSPFRSTAQAGGSGAAESDVGERDVTPRVIDVTPLSSVTRPNSGEETSGSSKS